MGAEVSSSKKRPLQSAALSVGSASTDEGFEESKDAYAPDKEGGVSSPPMSPQATVAASRTAFLEGNRLFRESKFDSAQQRYEEALRVLREHFVTSEQVRQPQQHAFGSHNNLPHNTCESSYARAAPVLTARRRH